MDRLLNMIFRMVVRKGMNHGMRAISRRSQPQNRTPSNDVGSQGQARTDDPNARAPGPKAPAQMRNASRLLRRLTRF